MALYYSTPDNKIKIYNDDYLEVKLDEKADLIVTSLPYNVDINYENYIVKLITTKEQHEVLKKLGHNYSTATTREPSIQQGL